MATQSSALVKRQSHDLALMPPPPTKRIKRPTKVLGEDEYTEALSNIIVRDYFPGLLETQAQQEYLSALESDNEAWIVEAGQKLREAMTPKRGRRSARNTRFDTPSATPRRAEETPSHYEGATPRSVADTEIPEPSAPTIDTSSLSLSSFQSKYTSEDNESFNALLDKQNSTRRQKYAHLWAPDQRIPSNRLIAYKAHQKRLQDSNSSNTSSSALTILGSEDTRPARPDSWSLTRPDNTFMFPPDSLDSTHPLHQTTFQTREDASKAGPKAVVHANTRFQPTYSLADPDPPYQPHHQSAKTVPPSPSLNTSIINRRSTIRADSEITDQSTSDFPGGETPRVNGYAFVDEDEPENLPVAQPQGPSYRDLLAGQVGDATPNPFRIEGLRKREGLHHRLVERDQVKRRGKDGGGEEGGGKTPGGGMRGSMTPAGRRLMEKVGMTPRSERKDGESAKEMWTPVRTPRRSGKVGRI